MTCSAWHIWHIRVGFQNEPMRQIAQTVKARSKDEAERKAGEYLSGRGLMVYEVIMQNAPLERCAVAHTLRGVVGNSESKGER